MSKEHLTKASEYGDEAIWTATDRSITDQTVNAGDFGAIETVLGISRWKSPASRAHAALCLLSWHQPISSFTNARLKIVSKLSLMTCFETAISCVR